MRRANLPTSPGSLLQDERQLRIIGDWGGASGYIGQRWEEIGTVALRQWVEANCESARVVDLAADENLRTLFGRLGMTNPDALLVAVRGEHRLLRPVDLKWTLEVASYRQISRDAFSELLSVAGDALTSVVDGAALELASGEDSDPVTWKVEDGFFFAVDSEANRRYLSSSANARQEYPIEPSEVIFCPTEPAEFFSSLPGWRLALRLAALDRSPHALRLIDGASAYYRLGAGVQGALLKLKVTVFDSVPTDGDSDGAFEELLANGRLGNSASVIAALQPELARRGERMDRFRAMRRSPFTFDQFREALASRGINLDEMTDRVERDKLIDRYRFVGRRHRDRVTRAGQNLIAKGFSESQALGALEKRSPDLQQRAAVDAEQTLSDL